MAGCKRYRKSQHNSGEVTALRKEGVLWGMKRRKYNDRRCGRSTWCFKTTVSRAISGKGRIGQETRDRVLKYIEEHDYKPNVIAKGLAQSKTYNLCVVMPGDYDVVDLTFFQECLFGIQEIAGIMEYDILLSICKITISPR